MSKKILGTLLVLVVLIAVGFWLWKSRLATPPVGVPAASVTAPAATPGAAPAAAAGSPAASSASAASGAAPQDPVFLAGSAFDACAQPVQPATPPSGATATRAQMLVSQNRAKAFDTATNAYLACVDQAATTFNQQYGRYLPPATLQQIRALQTKLHNGAVDVDEAVAGRFNRELRVFKGRSSTR